MAKPLILVDPLPRTLDLICDAATRRRLETLGRLVVSEDRPMPEDMVDQLLPETAILIGQTAMPRARLEQAKALRAIFNVETNFQPNIDYEACQARGIWVRARRRPSPRRRRGGAGHGHRSGPRDLGGGPRLPGGP
jgi:phosphoglycerate dehydrogenase-like enzyme